MENASFHGSRTHLRKWMEQQGGVVGVRDLADFFEVSEARVRDFAYENEVAKVGNTIVFVLEDAEALEADLAEEEAEDEELDDKPSAEELGDDDDDDDEDEDE